MARTRNVKPPPADETKRQKFRRLAQPRLNRVIQGIASLGKLSTSAYESRPADYDLMEKSIGDALAKMLARFRRTPEATADATSFKD